jgi:hypothetical protein
MTIGVTDYEIAIPSHGRARKLRSRTWKLLELYGLTDRATIFVADEDLDEYAVEFPLARLRIGALGLNQQRRKIHSAFPRGTRVLSLDDDLLHVKSSTEDVADLDREILWAFQLMEEFRCGMWGINPAAQPLFLRNAKAFSVGAMNVEACLYGFVSGRADLDVPDDSKFDDFERVYQLWAHGWNVLRLNQIGHQTSTSVAGGKDAATFRVNNCGDVQRIVSLYPWVAEHGFGKLTGQSKCRVTTRRGRSVACPRDLADVDELRLKILNEPWKEPPPIHDFDPVTGVIKVSNS